MKIKSTYLYFILVVIHTCIALYAFEAFFRNPGKVIFCNEHDGMKNYYTLYSYVKEPLGKDGLFKYNSFKYPYGDYVYATDNTPGFSIALRWFCHHVWDVSDYTIILFNLYVILNIIVAGPLVFYIFRNILKDDFFAFMSAVLLPWMNIQLPRIWNGHNNLSFFSLALAALCLLIAWYKNRENTKKLWLISLLMIALCFFSFMQHGYFIAIITMFVSGTLFAFGLLSRKEKYGKHAIIASVAVTIVTLGLALLLLQFTDGYLHLRPKGAEGYDYYEAKTRLSNLFTPYFLHSFYFPIRSVRDGNHEHAAYLGNISLYATLVIGLLVISRKKYRERVKIIQRDFFKDKFRLAMVLGGLLMLSVSLGEVYYTGPDGYYVYNILNPFFYIHQFTDYVEQFRSLARFNWPFFLVFNVWAVYTVARLYRQHNKKIQRVILAVFILMGYIEARDFIHEMRRNGADNNELNMGSINEEFKPMKLQFPKYQAILPIPYFHAGTENYDYNIDDYGPWSLYNFRLNLYTGLPLMSSKMSRTPNAHAVSLFNLVIYDQVDTSLRRLLNDKPVLVALNKTYIETNPGAPEDDSAMVHYLKMNEFVARNHLKPVDSLRDVFFYEWYPPAP